MHSKRLWSLLIALTLICVGIGSAPLLAKLPLLPKHSDKDQTANAVPKNLQEYSERATNAAEVLNETMGIPDKGIPDDLMAKAQAVAVFPRVVKAAFIVGGRYGKGLVSQRLPNGRWSTPAFIQIGGGSVGLQIGGEATDLVLVFVNREGVESLLKGKVTLGGDASVAAGPVGRSAEAGTDVRFGSAIYSYSRSKGLFAGLALNGASITMDDSANHKVYGKPVTGEDILLERQVTMNAVVKPFVAALESHSPHRITENQTE
jgi:lipid-binding SYLF domain-containing protein